jgi:IS5 family transposase
MGKVLTKHAEQVETLWEEVLPQLLHDLPADLDRLDEVLDAPEILRPFEQHWGRANLRIGRPSIAIDTYLRMMLLKHRHGWGYERLVAIVADSFQLRRFCRISIMEEVPDESTIRKLTRRLGPELVEDLTRSVVSLAITERGFKARAMRCDSTVQESDVRYPTDCGLASDAVRVLARGGRKLRAMIPGLTRRVRDRSRAAARRVRELNRNLRRRTGEAKQEVQRLTEEVGALAKASVGQARRLLVEAKDATRDRQLRRRELRAIAELEEMIGLSAKVVEQIRLRFAGEKIEDRLVSLFDPDARPIRKGKKAHPNEFGEIVQYTEVTPSTRHGARGLLLPPQVAIGNPHENVLLPQTVAELVALELRPKEAVFDQGFTRKATTAAMEPVGSTVFIAGSHGNAGSRRTRKRLASHRVGCEGRIAHVKREYGAGRSRLKGDQGARIWAGWAALAYDLDTVARLPRKTNDTAD